MTEDVASEVQTGIEAALKGDPRLAAVMELKEGTSRVYDAPPANVKYPHIVLGEDQILADDAEGIEGADVFVDLHVWDRTDPPGLKRAKRIANVAKVILLAGFVVHGFDLKQVLYVSTRALMDPDEQSGHVVLTVRLMLEPLNV